MPERIWSRRKLQKAWEEEVFRLNQSNINSPNPKQNNDGSQKSKVQKITHIYDTEDVDLSELDSVSLIISNIPLFNGEFLESL